MTTHLLLATEMVWELACRRGVRAQAKVVSDRHRSTTRSASVTCLACIRVLIRTKQPAQQATT